MKISIFTIICSFLIATLALQPESNIPATHEYEDQLVNERFSITLYRAGQEKLEYRFKLTNGLAIGYFNLVTDIYATEMTEGPDNLDCLFWRTNEYDETYVDRDNVINRFKPLIGNVEGVFGVLCYDRRDPEILTGFRSY